MKTLLAAIERALPEGGAWCDLTKATTLASIVLGLRPEVVVEIGVWMGGSLVPMLLAMRHVGKGTAIAIDPWSPDASVEGQGAEDATWWGQTDHEAAYRRFLARLEVHDLTALCQVVRLPSEQVLPPPCQLLHLDGNHGPQAVRDVERFAPLVDVGGILVLDDVAWTGGHVIHARERAEAHGFRALYELGTGVVMQRRGPGSAS